MARCSKELLLLLPALLPFCVHAPQASAACAVKLTADDGAAGDGFGRVAISGDLAVIGASGDDDEGFFTGSAHVFRRDPGGVWTLEAKLTAADADDNDYFGNAVAISGDLIVVGAFFDEEAGSAAGSAYVFRREREGEWIQEAKLIGDGVESQDRFGFAVAIDGDLAIIGAPGVPFFPGHAYAFRRDGDGVWTQEARWTGDGPEGFDKMGWSVSMSGDLAAIGNPSELTKQSQGAVYVFRTDAPGHWIREARLLNEKPLTESDLLGIAVAIDGNVIVAGASPFFIPPIGVVYVFRREARGLWNEETILLSGETIDRFGEAVDVSGDTIIVGDFLDDDFGFQSGAAYVYRFDPDVCEGGECSPWVERAKLRADDAVEKDRFGQFVGLDRGLGIVGVPGDDDACPKDPICSSGSAWVYCLGDRPGDLDGDGSVGTSDLIILLAAWGSCVDCNDCPEDLDGDCTVGFSDLLILLSNWG